MTLLQSRARLTAEAAVAAKREAEEADAQLAVDKTRRWQEMEAKREANIAVR